MSKNLQRLKSKYGRIAKIIPGRATLLPTRRLVSKNRKAADSCVPAASTGVSYTVGGATAPGQARKAIGFEDLSALKFLFAKFSKDNHRLTSHFAPPTFSESSTYGCKYAVKVKVKR